LAVDRHGDPIGDLRAEEILLFVDKESRKIVTLSPTNAEQRAIGLFFDISGSRRSDSLIPQEVEAAGKFLESVWRPGDVAFAIAFGEVPVVLAQPTTDLRRVQQALQDIPRATYRGSTALYDALCSVHVSEQQTERGERLFVVVGDFEDNTSRKSRDNLIQIMHEERTRVFPLLRIEEQHSRGGKVARNIARKVAETTGGDLLEVTNEKDLDAAFRRLAGELQGAYLLTYETSPQEGKHTNYQIQTTRRDVTLLFPR
jgi:VWFA-related protein